MSVGENIKLKREELGITRNQLVESSGVSTAQIARIERGEQNNPNLETLVAISTALKSSLDELVFGEDSKSSAYLSAAIDQMPKERQTFLRELIKMTIMISKSEEIDLETRINKTHN